MSCQKIQTFSYGLVVGDMDKAGIMPRLSLSMENIFIQVGIMCGQTLIWRTSQYMILSRLKWKDTQLTMHTFLQIPNGNGFNTDMGRFWKEF